MSNIDSNRFTLYALWEDLFQVISYDIDVNKGLHSSYSSAIIESSIKWLENVGESINNCDAKTAYHYLTNIGQSVSEIINSWEQGRIKGKSEEWMKPFYELYQTSQILILIIKERTL